MAVPWEITPEKVESAVSRIAALARPRRVILFGSYVRGTSDHNSDLDILVVTRDDVEDPRQESVRLRRALGEITMPMDILVVSERQLQELADRPGLVYQEALRTGRVAFESAA